MSSVTVTDTLFLMTEDGLIRPSDADGKAIKCEDGRYRVCSVVPQPMNDFWSLFLSNGMILELNEGSGIRTTDRGWVGLWDVYAGCSITNTGMKFREGEEPLELDLEDVTENRTGTFNMDTVEFAKLAAIYATSSKVYKNGDISLLTHGGQFKKLAEHFELNIVEEGFSKFNFRIQPSYITEILEACFGKVTTKGEGFHYIPDFIILNASDKWIYQFVKEACRCYAKAPIVNRDRVAKHSGAPTERISYSSFGVRNAAYVNDLVHLIQRVTARYDAFFSIAGSEPSFYLHLPSHFKGGIPTPVKLINGYKLGVKKQGYKIDIDSDKGIYLSGFYVK